MLGLNCIPVICRWFGRSSILADCSKPGFKHKGINFIYLLHCIERFSKTVNYGLNLQWTQSTNFSEDAFVHIV